MLSASSRAPRRAVTSRTLATAACQQARANRGTLRAPPKPRASKQQTVLAVARQCRECGARLGALEGAMHRCVSALEWAFSAEEVAGAWAGARMGTGTGRCRIVRLGLMGLTSLAAREQFKAIWGFIRDELSHGLDLPTPADICAGTSVVLLGLRGRGVVGFLLVESVNSAVVMDVEAQVGCDASGEEVTADPTAAGLLTCELDLPMDIDTQGKVPDRQRVALGIRLMWVRRCERRRGVATALVDAARKLAGGPGAPPVPLELVGFSQPTRQGLSFAARYQGASRGGRVFVYSPACRERCSNAGALRVG